MNSFENVRQRTEQLFGHQDGVLVFADEPARSDGVWTLTLSFGEDYMIVIEWNRHRGFGLSAGRDLIGSGVDEVYSTPHEVLERIELLHHERLPTAADAALNLSDLRKVRGLLQSDVAARLGVSKSSVAQLEQKQVGPMQVSTLKKLVATLGGELVVAAKFPDGERRIALE